MLYGAVGSRSDLTLSKTRLRAPLIAESRIIARSELQRASARRLTVKLQARDGLQHSNSPTAGQPENDNK